MNHSIIPVNQQSDDDPFEVFKSDDWSVRIINRGGEPWFVANDVCESLKIADAKQALDRLDEDEKDRVQVPTPGGIQYVICVSEPGLYSLIFSSRKPEAKKFKRWITHEVIPAIRKTGGYSSKPMTQLEVALVQLQTMVEHERQLADHDQRIEVLEAEIDHQTDYYTVIGYCRLKHYSPITHEQAIELGRRCASLSRKLGVAIGKTSDQKYGQVGTYHIRILQAVFEGQS